MVETGSSDGAARDDGRRVAAFSSEIVLPPGGETKIAIAFGEAPTRADALAAAARLGVASAEDALAATRASWAERLGKVEVRTNRPDFDRLVNTWLPYQLYASRLFGRVGPNQLGGATGYRDQLQDVLPLTLLEPRLTRAQIVLHASQQFREGDVLKWWHRAPGGGTGLGQRTKASDPHLWLPYVLARYVRESGDRTVLDERTPFLEAEPVPAHEETWIVIPRVSRESATVYEHARLAIAFTLEHLGANGLPLLRAGDWNDGIDMLGRRDDRDQRRGWASSSPMCSKASSPSRARRATKLSPPSANRRSLVSARRSRPAGAAIIICSTSPTTDARSTCATP